MLIGLFLCIKLALSLWNACEFDGKVYDQGHHQDRALFGGLRPGKLSYDPPLYYLPALLVHRPADVPLVERNMRNVGGEDEAIASREAALSPPGPHEVAHKAKQIQLLRYTNVFYGFITYVGWICFAYPRLLRGFRGWFLASLLLLCVPGYQKLGAMVHPDNAFTCLVTVGVCVWLAVRERFAAGKLTFLQLVGFAVAVGSIGLTRPFSIMPVAVLTATLLVYLVRLEGFRWSRLLVRGGALLAIVVVLSSSWYVYRWRSSGHITNAYRDGYMEKFEKRKVGFSFVEYFTTFHAEELLEVPNRKLAGGTTSAYSNTPHANSFFTILYSEVWGDHWLYFSGLPTREGKLWPKRTLLAAALLTPPVVLLLGAGFFWDLGRRSRQSLGESRAQKLRARLTAWLAQVELDLVLLGLVGSGVLLYLYWQTGPGLLPGKHSTIKFIYVANLVAPTLALVFKRRLRPLTFNLLSCYFLLLFVVALPVAMFWPS